MDVLAAKREYLGQVDSRFGLAVRNYRTYQSMSQRMLAYVCQCLGWEGADQTMMSKIETGKRPVTVGEMHVLATALGVSTMQFLAVLEDGQR